MLGFEKGDVIEGTIRQKSAAYHYIVYIEDMHSGDFIGAVLTTSGYWPNNALMKEDHFLRKNTNGEEYKIQFSNSHVVEGQFIKFRLWGPFSKVGKLTEEGLSFVEQQIKGHSIRTWEEYLEGLK